MPSEDVRQARKERGRFFELSLDMLCIANFEGYFVQLNPSWSGSLGWTDEELRARPYIEFVHPEDRAATLAAAEELTAGDDVITFENRYRCKDGSYRWLWWNATAFPQEQTIYAVAHDVTKRKQAEEALHNSRRRYQALFEEAPVMYVITHAQREGPVITDCNTAFLQTLGYEKEAVVGRQLTDFYTPASKQALEQGGYRRALQGQLVDPVERQLVTRDGQIIDTLLQVAPLPNEAQSGEGTLAMFSDISDRKRVQEALAHHVEALERSNAELEQFAYVASHDLKEPLRAIASHLQLLQRRYEDQLGEDADRFISRAVAAADRMKTLINDLLAYSRVTRSSDPFASVVLADVFDQVLDNLQVAIKEHNATITRDPLPTIVADDVQLEQLLQNLVSNAIKFHGDESPRVHVGATRQENGWCFSVQDNGIGIMPDYAERIFEMFQRLHTRQEYEGTGIGLAICRKIVERHNGRIWMESEPGESTTFFFTIADDLKEEP